MSSTSNQTTRCRRSVLQNYDVNDSSERKKVEEEEEEDDEDEDEELEEEIFIDLSSRKRKHPIKIAIIGSKNVGKTTIASAFNDHVSFADPTSVTTTAGSQFMPPRSSTFVADVTQKSLKVRDVFMTVPVVEHPNDCNPKLSLSDDVIVKIWDSAGYEVNGDLPPPQLLGGSDVVVICFAWDRSESIDDAIDLLAHLDNHGRISADCVCLLLGTMVDRSMTVSELHSKTALKKEEYAKRRTRNYFYDERIVAAAYEIDYAAHLSSATSAIVAGRMVDCFNAAFWKRFRPKIDAKFTIVADEGTGGGKSPAATAIAKTKIATKTTTTTTTTTATAKPVATATKPTSDIKSNGDFGPKGCDDNDERYTDVLYSFVSSFCKTKCRGNPVFCLYYAISLVLSKRTRYEGCERYLPPNGIGSANPHPQPPVRSVESFATSFASPFASPPPLCDMSHQRRTAAVKTGRAGGIAIASSTGANRRKTVAAGAKPSNAVVRFSSSKNVRLGDRGMCDSSSDDDDKVRASCC